jgi:hypothetical protein
MQLTETYTFRFRPETDLHLAAFQEPGRYSMDCVALDPAAGIAYATDGRVLAWASVTVEDIAGEQPMGGTEAPRHPEVLRSAGNPTPQDSSTLILIPVAAWKEARKQCKGPRTLATIAIAPAGMTVALPDATLTHPATYQNPYPLISELIRRTFDAAKEEPLMGQVRNKQHACIDPDLLTKLRKATQASKDPIGYSLDWRGSAWIIRQNGTRAVGIICGRSGDYVA